MAADSILKIKMPAEAGTQLTEHVRPGETLDLSGISLSQLSVDILGPDIILSNPENGAKIIFPGLGLILFSETEAPKIIIDGQGISPDQLLGAVGKIQNITQKDYLSFTSLEINPKDSDDTEDKKEDEDKAPEETQARPDPEQELLVLAMQQSPQKQNPPTPEQAQQDDRQELFKNREEYTQDAVGPPPIPVKISKPDSPPPPPPVEPVTVDDSLSVRTTFDFDARLLQLARTSGVESVGGIPTTVIRGGGGSEASVFNPVNVRQYSTELIDTVSNPSDLVIYADDSRYFSETQATRVIQISPNLPDGFEMSEIVISGLPAGFSIEGAVFAGGAYTLANPVMDERGDININLIYDIPGSVVFTATFTAAAEFDPLSGVGTPAFTSLDFEATQKFELKDVNGAGDLNYTDVDGDEVWVLSNTPNANRITTGDGNITVYGGKGVDDVITGAGSDTVQGGRGDDTLDGGAGTDTVDYSDTVDDVSLDLSDAPDINGFISAAVGGTETDLVKGFENITGGSGGDTLTGNAGANVLLGGDGNDSLMGGGGNDTLAGGSGVDTVDYSYAGNGVTAALSSTIAVAINVTGGDSDTVSQIENVTGTAFDDTLTGSDIANTLIGGLGNDTLTGGLGDDRLDGGGGAGDVVDYSAAAGAVVLDLSAAPDADGYVIATIGGGETDLVKNIENITGSAFADTLDGSTAAQTLGGNAGNDDIHAGDGNDIVYGGVGSDTLDGGNGTDELRFDDLGGSGVVLDLVAANAAYAPDASIDNFSNFEIYYATAQADSITGSAGTDTVFGLAGNDVFYASTGNDVLDAGAGAGDTIDYTGAAGAITASLDTGAATGIGNHTLTNFENVTGSALGDTITGSSVANVLLGGDGDDTLRGFGATGVDIIDGGLGNDTVSFDYIAANGVNVNFTTLDVNGYYTVYDRVSAAAISQVKGVETFHGSGLVDTVTGDNNANIIYGFAGNDVINSGSGADTVYGGANDDTLNGGDNDDSVYGETGLDTISGGLGNDMLYGGDDNDTINGDGGNDTLDGGNGTDIANYYNQAGITGSLTIDLRTPGNLFIAHGAETDTLLNIERIVGSQFADTFHGSAGNDHYTENAGSTSNDLVYASLGADTFDVGGGTDTINYVNATTGVTVSLIATSGSGWGTQTLTAFENVTGSDHADTLTGNDSANIILGGLGNDIIATRLANDTVDGEGGTDTVTYSWLTTATVVTNLNILDGSGYFTITVGAKADLARNVENITGGSMNDSITGDVNANVIDGGGGNDTINSGSGNDTVLGGAGTDTLSGGNGNDIIDGGADTDTVNYGTQAGATAISFNLSTVVGGYSDVTISGLAETDRIVNVEIIYGTAGIDTMTGNASANTFYGGGNNDIISGGAGNDSLHGEDGNDTINGDDNDDTLSGGNGNDTINGGNNNDTLFGGAGDDALDGGSGTDYADYSDASVTTAVNASLLTLTATGTSSGMDTFTGIENLRGSAHNDTLAGDNNNNTFFGMAGDDDIRGNDGIDTINGGDGADTLRGGDGNDVINGDAGNDVLIGGVGNDTMDGGTGSQDAADYSSSTAFITANLSLASNNVADGLAGTDTVTNIEKIIGSDYNDLFTDAATVNNVFEGGAGDDTFYAGTNATAGSNTYSGGADSDTIDYSSFGSALTGTINSTGGFMTGSVNRTDGSFDTLSLIERVITTNSNDTFTMNTDSLVDMTSFDARGGSSDKIIVTNGIMGNLSAQDIDGDTLAALFTNVEEIDFRSTTLTGPDTFDISGLHVKNMTDANDLMRIRVSAGFNFTINNEGGFNLSSDNTAGNLRTVVWNNAGDTVTLQIETA